jgi:exonuclease SbcC
MTGIGPFPGEVHVDFEHLDATGLYLIVGPTGSGKTTIFEAMTFALFAKVPSGRDIETTFPHERSTIEFVFSHNGSDHRVVRDNTKSSGDFYEQLPKGARVAQRKAVTEHVQELLKLTADQFMKIILLPQGKFQEFLNAKTSEKEEILQQIFGTEIYDNIALQVRIFKDEIVIELAEIQKKIDIASQAVANDVRSLRATYPDLGLPSEDDDFTAAKQVIASRVKTAKDASEQAASKVQKIAGDLAKAKDLERLFDENTRLLALRAEATEDASEVERATRALDAHERAERALQLKESLDSTTEQLEDAREQRNTLLRDLRRDAGNIKIDLPQVATFQGSLETSQNLPEEYGSMARAVNTAIAALDHIAELQAELDETNDNSTKLKADIKEIEKEIAAYETAKKVLGKQRSSTNLLVDGLAKLQKQVDALDIQLSEADVSEATEELELANSRLKAAQRTVDGAQKALQKAQEAQARFFAGQLAKHLHDGNDCPVCGSQDHPRPARSTSKTDVQAQIDRHSAAKTELAQAQRDIRDAQAALTAATKARAKLPTAAAQKKLRDQHKKAEAAARTRSKIEKAYDTAVSNLTEAKETKTDLAADLRGETANVKRIRAALTRAKADAPGAITSGQRDATKRALNSLQSLVRKKHTADEVVGKHTTKLATLDANIRQALRKEGFRTIGDAIAAHLRQPALRQLTQLVEQSARREKEINSLAARVEGHSIPNERPALAVLERELQDLRAAQTVASTRHTKLTSLGERLADLEVELAELQPLQIAARTRLNEAATLEKVMNGGTGAGASHVCGLQEWIQRRLFEQVCRVASEQLRELTGGRYIITLKFDAESAVKRAAGLDLYVFDSFNGKYRGVGSLSGGETFLASLALALALAEVVQTHAGGIKIPCLFIDEGFGSLDQETLEWAMDALLKLQHSGRTVGVVTHVEAMQRQLPIGVRVIRGNAGSRLEFPLLQ